MIVTVTMNPAIDKTIDIEALEQGGLNRIQHVEYDAGGKGINVSKTIRELGGKSIATGFLAGNGGKTIENVLNTQGIENDFVWVEGETRTNTKVVEKNGTVTELNEPGPQISEAQIAQLMEKLMGYAKEDTLIVLAGSVPASVSRDIYKDMIEKLHGAGAKVLLDADGDLFVNALEAGPDIIKPNKVELEEYAGVGRNTPLKQIVGIAKNLLNKGVATVAVSLGSEGALLIRKDGQVKAPGLKVKAHSTVGAGDAFVAALAYSWDEGLDFTEMMKTCMATSAGAVTTIGTKPPTKEVIEALKKEVKIEEIGE